MRKFTLKKHSPNNFYFPIALRGGILENGIWILELVDDLLYWNSSSSAKGIALKKERKKRGK